MAAEALEGEGGLGLRTGVGEGLAEQAEVEGARVEEACQQAVLAEGGDEGAVDAARFALLGDRPQPFGREGAKLRATGGLLWIE